MRAVANELVVRLPGDRARDDSDIALAISEQIKWSAAVPSDSIKATVTHGWVTLEGRVDWAYQSEAADKLARALISVKGVTNRVIVKPSVHYKDVKQKITDALHRQAQIDARRIWLTTDDGHVTMHGQVSSWSEAAAAKKAAESAPGVTKVDSLLTITPYEPAGLCQAHEWRPFGFWSAGVAPPRPECLGFAATTQLTGGVTSCDPAETFARDLASSEIA